MKEKYKFIFDMDGTLYQFDGNNKFADTKLYADIKAKVYKLLMSKLGISSTQAQTEYERLKTVYKGEVSLAIEKEFKIDRYEFFAETWNLDPKDYLALNPGLQLALSPFSKRGAILSGAPRVWVQAVLAHLGIDKTFGKQVFTGESDIRKPSEQVFRLVASNLDSAPELVVSIGDQEHTDILPAQRLGMKTVLIGTPQISKPDFSAPDILSAISLLTEKGFI